jgi:lia operon protein LiaG
MQALPALILGAILLLPTTVLAQGGERYTLNGDEIAIYNLAGTLSVEPGTGAVSVSMTRGGIHAAQLRVEQGEDDDGRQALRVIYPAQTVVYSVLGRGSSTTLRVREDGTFGDGDFHDRDDDGDREERDRGRRVRILGGGSGLEAHADLKVGMPAGARVAIYLAVGKVSIANVNGELLVDGHSAPITASGTKGALMLDVGSGSVTVTGAEGSLNVDTGSGSVEVSRFRGTQLLLNTGSGGVTGSDLQASEIHVDTGSGDIDLTAITSPVIALETGSGQVGAELRGTVRALAVETGSGDVSVRAPASLAAAIKIETGSGGIETDYAVQVTRHARDHMVGLIGAGTGRVEIETGSGDVRLLKSPK